MARIVDLDNPKIIKVGRSGLGYVIYHIPPDTPTITAEPIVDAKEVVRCKDCDNLNTWFCPFKESEVEIDVINDFCSRGERREE